MENTILFQIKKTLTIEDKISKQHNIQTIYNNRCETQKKRQTNTKYRSDYSQKLKAVKNDNKHIYAKQNRNQYKSHRFNIKTFKEVSEHITLYDAKRYENK